MRTSRIAAALLVAAIGLTGCSAQVARPLPAPVEGHAETIREFGSVKIDQKPAWWPTDEEIEPYRATVRDEAPLFLGTRNAVLDELGVNVCGMRSAQRSEKSALEWLTKWNRLTTKQAKTVYTVAVEKVCPLVGFGV